LIPQAAQRGPRRRRTLPGNGGRALRPAQWTRLTGLSGLALAAALAGSVGPATSKTRAASIEARDAWARPAQAGAGAGFVTLRNLGPGPDRLIGAASPWVERVEVQATSMTGGVMRMRPVAGGLEIAPGRSVTLAPGGYHLMLLGLKRPLKPGDQAPLTLQFERARPVRIHLTVRAPDAGGKD
jgi:copper(I)-binding protein